MSRERQGKHAVGWLIGAIFTLLALKTVGNQYLDGFILDFGGVNLPGPRVIHFLALYGVLGTLAAALLTVGLTRLATAVDIPALKARWMAVSDGKWMVMVSLLALLIPYALHIFLLMGAALADDDGAYEFMAQVLAGGNLYAESHSLKLFFDRFFMVNDGKFYAQYFLGWPALMAPGVWIGNTGVMNPIYSALTIPGLYFVLKRLINAPWARVGTLLYLISPMLMVGAATKMSHTTCMAALIYAAACFLKAQDESEKWHWHALFALSISVAFFIRPLSALALALPLILVWLWQMVRAKRALALVAFAVPALIMASAFLGVNRAQTGKVTQVAYQRALEYYAENEFRFAPRQDLPEGKVANLVVTDPLQGLGLNGIMLLRLNGALFGWPLSLLFAFLAGFSQRTRLWWLCLLSYSVFHYLLEHVGIDIFAPVHFYETAWNWILLTVMGLAQSTQFLSQLSAKSTDGPALNLGIYPLAAALALTLVGLTTYTPIRLSSIHRAAENITLPTRTAEAQGVQNAVVFASYPFAPNCLAKPTRYLAFWRPTPGPNYDDDILWVNHLDIPSDKRLMTHFPDRKGYVQVWREEDCKVFFAPLDKLEAGALPKGRRGGSERGLD